MEYTRTIKSKEYSIEYEDFGEHHMGANHIRIKLDRKFEGVSEFHSTNGNAAFDKSGDFLLVADASIILLMNYKDGTVRHCLPPSGCFFSGREFVHGAISSSLYGPKCDRKSFGPVSVDAPIFQPGLGKAKGGLMPSVYLPCYHSLFSASSGK